MRGFFFVGIYIAISEGHGDAALELLKAGAETDKRDVDGHLAIDLAPDSKVSYSFSIYLINPSIYRRGFPPLLLSLCLSLMLYQRFMAP